MASDRHNHSTRNTVTIAQIGPKEEIVTNKNIVKKQPKQDIRRNFFSNRVVDDWNNLPNSVKNASDVNNFKNLYDALKK